MRSNLNLKIIKFLQVYEEAARDKVFLSKYQRSLYNVRRLTGRPWWSKHQTPFHVFFKHLEDNWLRIRDEGLRLINTKGYFQTETENLKDYGEWKQLELYSRGREVTENCRKCPFTCKIVSQFLDAKNCRRGQVKFSLLHPGSHIWPHCGPTNCRLRSHLGLKVPDNTFLRVANETRY